MTRRILGTALMRDLRRCSLVLAIAVGSSVTAAQTVQSQQGHPDLSGVWQVIGSHPLLKTDAGARPPLLPKAREVYEGNIAMRRAGDAHFDATTLCLSPGMPRILTMSRFRIVQTGHLLSFLFEWNHRYRQVLVDRAHAHQDDLLYFGDATGKWAGDTLLVDSVEFTGESLLDQALPHGDALHLAESYTLADGGKVLVDQITIEDPQTFAQPWTTTLRFARLPDDTGWNEDVCVDRLHVVPSLMGPVVKKQPTPK
jgi:hypothetical protein